MLQANDRRSTVDAADLEEAPSPAELIQSIWGIIRRQMVVIVAVSLCIIVPGVTYVYLAPLSFVTEAALLLDNGRLQLFTQQPIIGDTPLDALAMESQIQILKSEGLARSVISNLRLTEDAEFVGTGRKSVISRLMEPVTRLIGLQAEPDADVSSQSESELGRALAAFAARLEVARVGGSFVIAISFRARNAERAAQIANAVTEAYVADQSAVRLAAGRRASHWLQERLPQLREQSANADRAALDFKDKNNIVTTGGGVLINDQRLLDLSQRLRDARVQTAAAQARLDQIKAAAQADGATARLAVVDTLNNPIITPLRAKYLELVNRESEWSARLGAKHQAVINLRHQIADIDRSILDELQRISKTYESELEIAKQREDAIEHDLANAEMRSRTTSHSQSELKQLESSAQSSRTLYENLQQRYLESLQELSFSVTDARVISRASPLRYKSMPNKLLILAMSVVGGLGCGVGMGFLRDFMDRTFRTTKQVQAALQTECIAVVPAILEDSRAPDLRARLRLRNPGEIVRDCHVLWMVERSPLSHFAEAIRTIKLTLDLRGGSATNKVIGFTSSLPSEGKSTIAANLAVLMAKVGARVILIDADLRRPSLSTQLAPGAQNGLVDVVEGTCSLGDAVWSDPTSNLKFLPAVTESRLTHPTEFFARQATREFFGRLRELYDYVVVDLAPIAPVVDTRATSQFIDAYFFVVEWGRTNIEVAQHVLDEAIGVHESIIGVILNKADRSQLARYVGSLGDIYSNKYATRYGLRD